MVNSNGGHYYMVNGGHYNMINSNGGNTLIVKYDMDNSLAANLL